MTKTELIDCIAQDLNMSKAEASRALEVVLVRITEGLARDEKVQIQGFGTFQAKTRKERKGRNPQTGAEMLIPASRTVGFKPGSDLKSKV